MLYWRCCFAFILSQLCIFFILMKMLNNSTVNFACKSFCHQLYMKAVIGALPFNYEESK